VLSCGFGQESFHALRPSFDHLVSLEIREATVTTSEILQRLLESCTRLQKFSTVIINAIDIIMGKPWACYRTLKSFRAFVNMRVFDLSLPSSSSSSSFITFSQLNQRLFERLGCAT